MISGLRRGKEGSGWDEMGWDGKRVEGRGDRGLRTLYEYGDFFSRFISKRKERSYFPPFYPLSFLESKNPNNWFYKDSHFSYYPKHISSLHITPNILYRTLQDLQR